MNVILKIVMEFKMRYFVVVEYVENVRELMERSVIIYKSDMTKKKKTYPIELSCTQCLELQLIDIPFGMLVTEFCKITNCPNCECGNNLVVGCLELDPLV